MIIDISDILSCENKEETKQVQIELTSFISKLGEFPIISAAPIELRIANRENKRLLIQGDVDLRVSIPCTRCLEEVPTDIHFSIDKDIKLEDSVVHDEDVEDNDYLIGFNLDIDRFIYGEILVNWPMKVLCRDDCKGICKVCGMNLNKGECNCQRTELDQEWQQSKMSLTNLRRCENMSICPKNKSSKGRRDKRRANWKMTAPALVKCGKCGELMMPHRVCKNCGSYNKKEIIPQD